MNGERSAELKTGIVAYRSNDYRGALIVWERLFQIEEDEQIRSMLQALIQIAGALDRLRGKDSASGSEKLMERAAQKLEPLPDALSGIAIARLREGLASCRVELSRLIGAGRRDLDRAHAPPLEDAPDSIDLN